MVNIKWKEQYLKPLKLYSNKGLMLNRIFSVNTGPFAK